MVQLRGITANKLYDPKALTKRNTSCGTGLSGGCHRHHSAPPSNVYLTSLKKIISSDKKAKDYAYNMTDDTKLVEWTQ